MAHAETCPVCRGSGCTDDGKEPRITVDCHGCNGKGWVEVGDTIPVWPVQPPGPTTYPYGLPPWFPIVTYTYSSDRGL